ncbi:hypothetical protein NHX12_004539, partial [Muraenolepis orangiensis]
RSDARIGKMKRRKPEDGGQREGAFGDDDSADGDNGRGFEEYEWAGQKRIRYGKPQYTEADVIPCSGAGEDQGEAREREALRGAVLNGGMPTNRITPEFSKWASD